MRIDDKPNVLPLPSASTAEPDARGGPNEHALTEFKRRLEAHQPAQPVRATDATHAARRRQLIMEINAMDRANPNIAIEGLIRGAIAGTIVQGIVYGVRLWYAEREQRPIDKPLATKAFAASRDDSNAQSGMHDAARAPTHQTTGGTP